MHRFFNRKNKEMQKSIYRTLEEAEEKNQLGSIEFDGGTSGELELEVINKKKLERVNTTDLNKAVIDYYERDNSSIEKIEEFFKENKALESFENFESFIFSLEVFEEKKLAGLSILLMRDTNTVEAIKFGILLSYFYPLVNYQGAVKIIVNLGAHPEFTYYSLSVLKQLNYYEVVKDNIIRRGSAKVREIEEKMK